ncbi:hypothetical protein GCM10020221_00650 [Streptomyces thioluteus]|uniref:Uncharacterized protein n=1 Tax=Streptomyces thioluteus TaxID=66431 RepID=A0ABN3WCS0_STRTU
MARTCAGTSRRNTSQPSGRTDAPIETTHETNTPDAGSTVARAIRRASFTAEKTVLPTGTHIALRSPVSTPSWRVSTDQAITAAANPSPCESPPSAR